MGTFEILGAITGAEGLLVGVAALDTGFFKGGAGAEDLEVGVEDLTGVDDLGGGATGLEFDGKESREVGVDGLDDLEAAGNVERLVGVVGLDDTEVGPPEVDDRRFPTNDELELEDDVGCLDTELPLVAGS